MDGQPEPRFVYKNKFYTQKFEIRAFLCTECKETSNDKTGYEVIYYDQREGYCCNKCASKLYDLAKKRKDIAVPELKISKPIRPKNQKKNYDIVVNEKAKIYRVDSYEKCICGNRSLEKINGVFFTKNSKRVIMCLRECKNCGKLLLKNTMAVKSYPSYTFIDSKDNCASNNLSSNIQTLPDQNHFDNTFSKILTKEETIGLLGEHCYITYQQGRNELPKSTLSSQRLLNDRISENIYFAKGFFLNHKHNICLQHKVKLCALPEGIKLRMKVSSNVLSATNCLICVHCNKAFLSPKDNLVLIENKKTLDLGCTVMFNCPDKILYICKGTRACTNKGHRIEVVTAVLFNASGSEVRIQVNHCKNCNVYFIDKAQFDDYRKRYGSIMGNFKIDSSLYSDSDVGRLSKESKLHLCGYNVGLTDALPDHARHNLLAYLIDHYIMDTHEIIKHLNFLMNQFKNKKSMERAMEKWHEDKLWVEQYKMYDRPWVDITDIKVWDHRWNPRR